MGLSKIPFLTSESNLFMYLLFPYKELFKKLGDDFFLFSLHLGFFFSHCFLEMVGPGWEERGGEREK